MRILKVRNVQLEQLPLY